MHLFAGTDGDGSYPLWATLAMAALAVLLAVRPGTAAAQTVDDPIYEDKGFYQSYVFGAPDAPSEPWMLAYGGRLYDTWWAVLFKDPPDGNHPAYPSRGRKFGVDTWRCVECHGWDYKGKDGRFATGPHATGIKGVNAMAGVPPARIATLLRDDTHRFTPALIPDRALNALALFISKGQVDTDKIIDQVTGEVRGNAVRGRAIFQNVCAICHDYDGMAWITGDDDELSNLGAIAGKDPWRGLHKVMNGQTYADMPAMRAFGLESVLDVLAYAQTLPRQ
jgi:thiosulfate dehydrogenase